MKSTKASLLLLLFVGLVYSSDPAVVVTKQGPVVGVVNPKSRCFRGIPYAAPPIANLRWQPPQPHAVWTEPRNALSYGATCEASEDCLFVNVCTPPTSNSSVPLPVMVWIHGGCYVGGSGNGGEGQGIIEEPHEVVIVGLNYRLGALGFLASPDIRDRTEDRSAGNFGIQDQRFALKWVQENIQAFGGNPSKVTIFGESAGAGSVAAHLVAPRSWPFFRAAIPESGAIAIWNTLPFDAASRTYQEVLHLLKCADLNCLLSLPFAVLHNVTGQVHPQCQYHVRWSPVVDGVEFTAEVWQLAQKGAIAQVPILVGSNHDEGTLFTYIPRNATEQQYLAYMANEYGASLVPDLLQLYPPQAYPGPEQFWYSAQLAWGDIAMTCPTRRLAMWHSHTAKVWVYFFTRAVPPSQFADHGAELHFVFNYIGNTLGPQGQKLALQFGSYWVNFATNLDPNGAGLPQWDPWAVGNTSLKLDFDIQPLQNNRKQQCDVWDAVLGPVCVPPEPNWILC